MTPGAISQRIRSVERAAGRRLFDRRRDGVLPTPAGAALWETVREAFERIETARDTHLRPNARQTLRLSVAPNFAYSVLTPRLGAFSEAHPGVRIAVDTEERLVDPREEPVDLCIRHGIGPTPGLRAEPLHAPELLLVASPALLKRYGGVATPADCLRYPLLPGTTGDDWPAWIEGHGLDPARARYGPAYGADHLTACACLDGQGLALLYDLSVEEYLAGGRLVQVLDERWPSRFAYYAVGLPESFERPVVRAFLSWLHGPGPDQAV